MTTGEFTKAKPFPPLKAPDPAPEPLTQQEMGAAKKGVRRRGQGRFATILAGRLMSQQGKLKLGE
jgi:hypothetical protein